jgi:putative aldouronate transport system substrate-binding protein
MRAKVFNVIMVIMALLMIIPAVTSCGGKSSKTPADSDGPVEITFFHWGPNSPALSYFNDALWVQELGKRTNVKLNFIGPLSSVNYVEAANVVLASGDIPDLMLYNWAGYNGGIEGAVKDGIALDYGSKKEYLDLLPNWVKIVNSDDNIRREVILNNGGMAVFSSISENAELSGWSGLGIRQDWLNRVGINKVPTTVDEFHAALLAFKQKDANGNGDLNDEIPFTDNSWHGAVSQIISAWGLRYNLFYPDPQNPGKLTYWTQYKNGQAFTEALTALAQWRREGLLDTDFFTQDDSQRVSKIVNDKAGVFHAYPPQYQEFRDAIKGFRPDVADQVKLVGVPRIMGPDRKPYHIQDYYINLAQTFDGIIISQKAEKAGKVPAILRLIDYMYSAEGSELINFGVEGVSYTKDSNGNHIWTPEVTNDPQYPTSQKVLQYANPFWGSFPKIASYEAWKLNETQDPDALAAHLVYVQGDNSILMPTIRLAADQAEEYNMIMTDINTAIEEFYIAVIIGDRPTSEIPAFLTQIQGMGINRAQEIYQKAYDQFMAK